MRSRGGVVGTMRATFEQQLADLKISLYLGRRSLQPSSQVDDTLFKACSLLCFAKLMKIWIANNAFS